MDAPSPPGGGGGGGGGLRVLPIATIGLAAIQLEVSEVGNDDELDIGQTRIALDHLRSAEGLLDFAVHLLGSVLHEYS